jgi:hypothetical protein
MELISPFLVLVVEILIERECWLVLVLVGYRREKKRQGATASLREGDSLGLAVPFFYESFFYVFFLVMSPSCLDALRSVFIVQEFHHV